MAARSILGASRSLPQRRLSRSDVRGSGGDATTAIRACPRERCRVRRPSACRADWRQTTGAAPDERGVCAAGSGPSLRRIAAARATRDGQRPTPVLAVGASRRPTLSNAARARTGHDPHRPARDTRPKERLRREAGVCQDCPRVPISSGQSTGSGPDRYGCRGPPCRPEASPRRRRLRRRPSRGAPRRRCAGGGRRPSSH